MKVGVPSRHHLIERVHRQRHAQEVIADAMRTSEGRAMIVDELRANGYSVTEPEV